MYWLALELVVAVLLSNATCILRQDQRAAYGRWRENPTTETRAEVDRQRVITRWHHIGFAGVLFVGMAAVTVPLIVLTNRERIRGTGLEMQVREDRRSTAPDRAP